jgi:hypothetical protein
VRRGYRSSYVRLLLAYSKLIVTPHVATKRHVRLRKLQDLKSRP